jgi:hypothetical protein
MSELVKLSRDTVLSRRNAVESNLECQQSRQLAG